MQHRTAAEAVSRPPSQDKTSSTQDWDQWSTDGDRGRDGSYARRRRGLRGGATGHQAGEPIELVVRRACVHGNEAGGGERAVDCRDG
jgi:hypothetical protein